ncbi:MAG: hypothetical protein ACLSCV_10575 [Acutalibacteraceae bacterium]
MIKESKRICKRRYRLLHLGASAPLNAMDTCLCMGGSVSGLHGFNKARGAEGEKISCVIGFHLCIPVSQV